MSDFLSRLAARAVRDFSRTPSVAPGANVAESHAEPPPVARVTPAAAAVRAEAPEVGVEAERQPPPTAPWRPVAARASTDAKPSSTEGAAPLPPPPPLLETAESTTEPVVSRETVTVVTAVPIPHAATVERSVESRVLRRHTVESVTADGGELPVRVHIGRLEVRANLEQPPQRPQRREPERPQGQTLSDYLRGKRTA